MTRREVAADASHSARMETDRDKLSDDQTGRIGFPDDFLRAVRGRCSQCLGHPADLPSWCAERMATVKVHAVNWQTEEISLSISRRTVLAALGAGAGSLLAKTAGAVNREDGPVDIGKFDGKRPRFELEVFFSGKLVGWGYTVGRFNALQNQFKISAKGKWNAASNSLTLKETYTFDDGHTDILNWTIVKQSASAYEGREDRIDGVAKGEQAGNAFHWTYRRSVPDGQGKTSSLGFDDWFWLQEPDVMVAHASLTKLGIEVARLSAFYRKV